MSEDASETLHGDLQQLLFSPKGLIEGFLLKVSGKRVQVSIEPSTVNAKELVRAIGKTMDLRATADRSHQAKLGTHTVYKLEKMMKLAGRAVKSAVTTQSISGVVAAIHYAKHGEPNGVILESGEFIHTRPPAMAKLKLTVGAKIVASGETRMTVLGTPIIEASKVNQVFIG